MYFYTKLTVKIQIPTHRKKFFVEKRFALWIQPRLMKFHKLFLKGQFISPFHLQKLLERKAFAARWLAPLLDALFHWGKPIAQQPMFISVQLLLLPYFRSNSLYQVLQNHSLHTCL